MVAIASCYLGLSGPRCLGFFTHILWAWGHVISEVILQHFPAGVIPYRAQFELKLLADQRLTNICLSASIAQVGARDNLPNTNKYKFCSRCKETGRGNTLEVPLFLKITPLFTDGLVLIICLYGLIQFNESPDCITIPKLRVKGRYVFEMQELMFFFFYSLPKNKKKERQERRKEK